MQVGNVADNSEEGEARRTTQNCFEGNEERLLPSQCVGAVGRGSRANLH